MKKVKFENLNECDCCGLDKPSDEGDNCYNYEEEYDTWVCQDCLDNGSADESGKYDSK